VRSYSQEGNSTHLRIKPKLTAKQFQQLTLVTHKGAIICRQDYFTTNKGPNR